MASVMTNKSKSEPGRNVLLFLTEEIVSQLDRLASQKANNRSHLVRVAIAEYIRREQEADRQQAA